MTGAGGSTILFGLVIFGVAGAALWDLHQVEIGSLTVYTTPALRDLLEKGLEPGWRAEGGRNIEWVYVAAGEEYNRLRMSGGAPEADLFLHASPLFLAKGLDEGHMLPIEPETAQPLNASHHGRFVDGGAGWYAFAWSPLVEVYAPRLGAAPDLATADLRYGLAHPTLSNSGIYTALFFEEVSPAAGEHARSRTTVQPVNARTNILGVADGSFDVTLGYEAVARFFHAQGARIAYDIPVIDGQRVSTPVLFSVALVGGAPAQDEAREFIDFLFTNSTQAMMPSFHLRSVFDFPPPEGSLPVNVTMVRFDWTDWDGIEDVLPSYEVGSRD